MVKGVLAVMLEEGYIASYEEFNERPGVNTLKIDLKYHKGAPVIEEIAKVSKSGRRSYSKVSDMKQMYGGLGVMIVSTSKGIVSDATAKKLGIGGEVLCKLF
jgi:small subunit ribosomal protein S8